jgi:hypothetical protein
MEAKFGKKTTKPPRSKLANRVVSVSVALFDRSVVLQGNLLKILNSCLNLSY